MALNKTKRKNNELKVALAGNPNSGKTTMFNELTVPDSMLETGRELQ